MMLLSELKIIFLLFFVPKFHLRHHIWNFDSEKVDQDEVKTIVQRCSTFLLRITQILHIRKIILGVSHTLTLCHPPTSNLMLSDFYVCSRVNRSCKLYRVNRPLQFII
jgi:hypothetical protein